MSLQLQMGYEGVPKSITNPYVNRVDALDVGTPMSFLTFIKILSVNFSPDVLQTYYTNYIKLWNSQNITKNSTETTLIVEKYRDFIKDISLNYTTSEEKQFLSKIDFNDPYDLDITIGFYSKKLKELSLFYNSKRHDVKYSVVRSKLLGTNFGSQKTMVELTLSYLKNLELGTLVYDFDTIKHNIEIEVEELYDSYPLYFNQTPNPKIYDNKDLDYGQDIFLKNDIELITEIFSGLTSEMRNLKEVDQLFDNKRLLTEKYMSTDFYYLSTGSTATEFISGKLFSANQPSGNLLNRDYPTTASTQRVNFLQTKHSRGFFKPSKMAIVMVDGITKSISVNLSALAANSLYYYPDPTIISNNSGILTFIVDDSYLKRNNSSGNATNQPNSTPFDTQYYGYVSKIEPSNPKYLNSIFDSGFIQDSKSDIYNNLFGLFKNDHRFHKTVEFKSTPNIINMLFNGGDFYDYNFGEGFNFNYATSAISGETIRSGLSTYTNGFSTFAPSVTLSFGKFNPYHDLISPTDINLLTTYQILEGAYIMKTDSLSYPDPIHSDLSAFEVSNNQFYYTTLYDGGIYTSSPLQRALLDTLHPSITATLTQFQRPSAMQLIDGGGIYPFGDFDIQFPSNEIPYVNSTNNTTIYDTTLPTFVDNADNFGSLMVRNVYDRNVYPILTALSYLTNKYSTDILSEISNNIIHFDIISDVIFIETLHYLIIEKLVFTNGVFIDPKTEPIYITHSLGAFDKLSNRFKIDFAVYYCTLSASNIISVNNFPLYPIIYKYDIINHTNSIIYPPISFNNTEFNIISDNVQYIMADCPILVYSKNNDIFNISFLLKDQNLIPQLTEYDFILSPDVEFLSRNTYNFSQDIVSNIFNNLNSVYIFAHTNISPTFNIGELII